MQNATRDAEACNGPCTFDEYIEAASRFLGCAAPGLIPGGFMVAEAICRLARRHDTAGPRWGSPCPRRASLCPLLQDHQFRCPAVADSGGNRHQPQDLDELGLGACCHNSKNSTYNKCAVAKPEASPAIQDLTTPQAPGIQPCAKERGI